MLTPIHRIAPLFLVVLVACSSDEAGTSSNTNSASGSNNSSVDIAPIDESWEPTCAEDLIHFQEKLWEPMLSFQCITCHSANSLAGHTRLLLVDGHVQHNFETLWALAQVDDTNGPKLLMHPSGQGSQAHTGGDLLELESSNYQAMEYWIARARDEIPCVDEDTPAPESQTMQPGPRLLRRLSHQEYRHTIATLFPYAGSLEINFAPDNVIEDYSNNADALIVSPLLGDQYRETAETLGQLFAQNVDTHIECNPEQIGAAQCTAEVLTHLGSRIFRRPLTNEEAQRYFDIWYEVAEQDGYLIGLQWMLTAMLQSPHFLYRSELGQWQSSGYYDLTAYEIATELAYNLTGYPPDDELYNLAANGSLLDENVVLAQANRLMQTQAGSDQFWDFMQAWLGLDQLRHVTRSPEVYPELTPNIRTAMLGQTQRLARDAFTGGSLQDLFETSTTYLTDELAEYYGLSVTLPEPDADGFSRISQNENYRGGILTEGAFLTTYAKANSSSPIHRGILVREKLFCQHLPPPPANLDTSPPEMDLTKSTRERYIEHAENPACSGCHNLIDPIGFAFEHFDGIGRYRELDGIHTINDQGEILHTSHTDGSVSGAQGISSALAHSIDVQSCFTQQWLQYTYGLHGEASLESTKNLLASAFSQESGNIQAGLLAMVTTPHFRQRAEDPDRVGTPTAEVPTDWTAQTLLGGRDEPVLNPPGSEPLPTGLEVDISEASRWSTGACFDVSVTNNSDESIVWQIEIPLEGTLENLWSAEVSENGVNFLLVHGLSWNENLSPGSSTTFGYCVSF